MRLTSVTYFGCKSKPQSRGVTGKHVLLLELGYGVSQLLSWVLLVEYWVWPTLTLCCHILDLDVTVTCDHEALRLEDSAPCQRYDSGARHVVLLL